MGTLALDSVDSPYPGLLSIGQNVTEKLLADHLMTVGVSVERSTEAVTFAQDRDGVTVGLRDAAGTVRDVRARWVIGCEGGASMVRESLNVPFRGHRYQNEVFVQTDAVLRWSYPRGVYMFLHDGGAVIVSPYDDEGYSRIICAMVDPDPSNMEPPTLAEMQRYVRAGADPDAVLSEPVGWLTRYRTQHKIADRFRHGRAFLCGDAGHVHVPLGGQGMNTGMQDAFNLAWKLAHVVHGWVTPEVLDTYDSERHPVAEGIIKGTDTGYQTVIQPGPRVRRVVKTIGPKVLRLRPVRDRLINTTAEIDVSYAPSILVAGGGGFGLKPGSRVPDAPLVRYPEMADTSLFDLLRGPKWTLLLINGGQRWADADLRAARARARQTRAALSARCDCWLIVGEGSIPSSCDDMDIAVDRTSGIRRKFAFRAPTALLVRPDWYVGFRGDLRDADQLGRYLRRLAAPSVVHPDPGADGQESP